MFSRTRAVIQSPRLSQQTTVIVIVCASFACLVLLASLYRVLLSRCSTSAPLPPVQPLALHREHARIHAELRTGSTSHLSPPPVFSPGSKSSLPDSHVTEDQASSVSGDSPKQPSASPSTYSSVAHLANPSGSRSISSYNTYASRRTRHNAINGPPHGPRSNIDIILPAPLASGLHQATVGQPHMKWVRTPSFVDQWVTRVAGHEPGPPGLYALRQKFCIIFMAIETDGERLASLPAT